MGLPGLIVNLQHIAFRCGSHPALRRGFRLKRKARQGAEGFLRALCGCGTYIARSATNSQQGDHSKFIMKSRCFSSELETKSYTWLEAI
jgi:hypothetical protein